MRVKGFSVNYKRKVGLPQYSSCDGEFFLHVELDPGDDEEVCARAAWQMAKNNVMAQVQAALGKQGASNQEIWLGLPEELREHVKIGQVNDPQIVKVICSGCGTVLDDPTWAYCPHCGNVLDSIDRDMDIDPSDGEPFGAK